MDHGIPASRKDTLLFLQPEFQSSLVSQPHGVSPQSIPGLRRGSISIRLITKGKLLRIPGIRLSVCFGSAGHDLILHRAGTGISPSALPIFRLPDACRKDHGENSGEQCSLVCALDRLSKWKFSLKPLSIKQATPNLLDSLA